MTECPDFFVFSLKSRTQKLFNNGYQRGRGIIYVVMGVILKFYLQRKLIKVERSILMCAIIGISSADGGS